MIASRAFIRLKLFLAFSFAVLSVCAVAQTVDGNPAVKQEVLDQISETLSQSAFVPGIDFSKWPQFMAGQKVAIDAAKSDDEFRTAVNAALHKFGASHVVLLTPKSSQARRTGATVGVGISIQIIPEGFAVVRVVKDGPAEKAGITLGDLVVEVDGKPVTSSTTLSGDEGSEVAVKIKHADGKFDQYKLTRQKYSTIRSPELTWVDEDTAQLKIYSFEAGYDRRVISDLIKDVLKAKNLILDLRFNGGGAVSNLQHLLGMLVPDGRPVGTFIRRSTVSAYIDSTGEDGTNLAAIADWSESKFRPKRLNDAPLFTGHLAVLINRFSGSASEIAAAALHDVMAVPVIGTKSAGAVLASVIDPVSNGFTLQYPIEDYVTIKGIRLEGAGVTPDILALDVNLRLPASKDDAVEKALVYFDQAKFFASSH